MSDRQKELRLRVSSEELEQIQENAKTLQMQVNPFVRYIGREYAVIIEDRFDFDRHRDTIGTIDRFLNYLERSFVVANVYRPKEMCDVYEIRKEVFYLFHRLYAIMIHHRTKAYRAAQEDIQHQIENIIADHIPKPDKRADKRPHSIRIKVSPHEFEKIQRLAAIHHLPIGVYLRYASLHPHFVHITYPMFEAYTRGVEMNMIKILEIANKICRNGDYEWYEPLLVLRALINVAKNERRLILEVAHRRPRIVTLGEKYKDIIMRYTSDFSTYQWALHHGMLYDDEPSEIDIDWMDPDIPTRIVEEPISPITDTYSADVVDIIQNATKRSHAWSQKEKEH